MTNDAVPDSDHISRLCAPKHIEEGKIQATAFQLRIRKDRKEDHLSVNWVEYFKCENKEEALTKIRKILSKKLGLAKKAQLALLNVGETREQVKINSPDKRELEIRHAPTQDPSHAGIFNLKQDDELIAELILETIIETHPAQQPKV